NGSNTTAVAAVAKMVKVAGDVRGKRVLIVAGTGPVGIRAAGLFAKAGADVCITSRKADACFFSSRILHTRFDCDWSSDVCSSDLLVVDATRHVGQVEPSLLGRQRGVEDDLEQQVAQLLLEVGEAGGGVGLERVDGLEHLVGLLQ